jgi:hypothetical protein
MRPFKLVLGGHFGFPNATVEQRFRDTESAIIYAKRVLEQSYSHDGIQHIHIVDESDNTVACVRARIVAEAELIA